MNKVSGIYKITNNITGDFYIGSSKDIKMRWKGHKSPSKWARWPGMKLYQAFIKYGLDQFKFEVIEETSMLKEREQYYIEQLKPSYNDRQAKGWNNDRLNETHVRYNKAYYARLCFYSGEILNLHTLTMRFQRRGISSPTQEAKKYLLEQ